MPANPKITIITPAYNVGTFIEDTIASVQAQTFNDYEHLIVDDESTDDTAELVERAIKDDPRARLIRAPHGGSSAARNAGLAEAKGQYISFIDGDDLWRPRKLERQLQLLESLPERIGAVFCASRIVSEQGSPMWLQMARSGEYDFDDYLAWYSPPRNGSSLVLRRTVFDDAGLFNTQLAAGVDMEMWLRVLTEAKSPNFYGTKQFMVDYRRRSTSLSGDVLRILKICDDMLAEWAPKMTRLPIGAAYVRPSLVALGKGTPEIAELTDEWVAKSRSAGLRYLMGDVGGRRLLGWLALGPRGRLAARRSRAIGFDGVRWAADRAGSSKAKKIEA